MFSNIPINLLSETQLGGCTALSCVLGRRRQKREKKRRGESRVDICFNKEGNLSEPPCCAHTCSYTHACTHIRTHAGLIWLHSDISSLVGFVHMLLYLLLLSVFDLDLYCGFMLTIHTSIHLEKFN